MTTNSFFFYFFFPLFRVDVEGEDAGKMNEEMGVAVVFDDESEDEEGDNDVHELRDEEDEDDGEGGVEVRELF